MNRDLCNFARIEFDRHELEALHELRKFVDQVAPSHSKLLAEDVDFSRKVSAVRRAMDAAGKRHVGKKFHPVDLTQDECLAVDYMAEGFLQAMREATLPGISQNQRIGNFAVVLSRVRMKVSAAAQAIKPNIATDRRLS